MKRDPLIEDEKGYKFKVRTYKVRTSLHNNRRESTEKFVKNG